MGVIFVTGCGRIRRESTVDDPRVKLEMAVEPAAPAIGPARLIFTLTDVSGTPINDATLDIEGNMTHAGMVPVLAQATSGQNGQYVVPFEWTMSGDWIVTVDVLLADGQQFSQQIPVGVQ